MAPQMGDHLPPIGWSQGSVRGFEREWVLEVGFAPAARHSDKAFRSRTLIEGVPLHVDQNPSLNTFNHNGSQPDLFLFWITLLALPTSWPIRFQGAKPEFASETYFWQNQPFLCSLGRQVIAVGASESNQWDACLLL